MEILIFIVIVIVLIIFVPRWVEISKLKPIIKQAINSGLSRKAIYLLLVRDATRKMGRTLNESEVEKIKKIVEKVIIENKKEIQVEKDDDIKDIFKYLSNNASPFLTQKDEHIILIIPAVGLREPRSIRTSSGGYGGTSFRVTKGIRVNTGRFSSTSLSHEELKNIDGGDLVVTNRRLFFAGNQRTANVIFKKIVSIEPYSNGIVLHKDGKERAQYFLWPNNLISIKNPQTNISEPLTGSKLQELIQRQITG